MSKLFVDFFETGLKDITEPTLPMPEVPKGPKGPTPKTNYPRYIPPFTQPKIELLQTKTFYPKYTKIDIEPPKIEGPIKVNLLYHSGEGPQRIKASVRERMPTQPIEQEPRPIGSPYLDTELPEETFKLPEGSLDAFKTRFDTHIKKLKSIEFKIPTQLKEIYLDLVEKLNNILNYIEDVAVGLFAELVEYIGRFIQWLTGPTERTAEDILIEINDVNETVELVENVIKK